MVVERGELRPALMVQAVVIGVDRSDLARAERLDGATVVEDLTVEVVLRSHLVLSVRPHLAELVQLCALTSKGIQNVL